MSARDLARSLVPPIVLDLLRRWSGRSLRFAGNPLSWDEAIRMSSGYSDPVILGRVLAATRAVTSGQARYERDAMLFDKPTFPFPVLAALLRAAAQDASRLDVIDFGGSLGSTYRQCRPFLTGLSPIRWSVVEQASFVEAGHNEFTTDELKFFASLSDLPERGSESVVLLSSVLQYLDDPLDRLREMESISAGHLIIDRTPLSEIAVDRLCIQHVPTHIYAASYPCWILSRSKLLDHLSRNWRLVAEYPCPEGSARTEDGLPFAFQGLILEKTR
jgi:putative methyltransferase (TIGR04325 family)